MTGSSPEPVPPPAPRRRKSTAEKVKTPFYRWFVLPVTLGIYRLLRTLIDRLSPAQVYAVADALAAVAWHLSAHHRGRVLRNLELAYGDRFTPAQRVSVAREVLRNFFRTTLDLVLLQRFARTRQWRHLIDMTPEQERAVFAIASDSRPVVFLTGHMGSWEFGCAFSGMLGRHTGLVYRPLDHPQVDEDVRLLRTAWGGEVIAKKGALRSYARILRSGGSIGIAGDQNARWDGAYLDFFGIAAATEVSYFPLFQRFMPRVVAIFIIRDGARFHFHMEGPFEASVNPRADSLKESMRLGQWYLDRVREMAEKYPEQYLWTHKRFAARPPGVPHLYEGLFQPVDPAVLAAQPRPPILPLAAQPEAA